MSLDMITALIGFAFVMSISPGPSNFILLATGANFGFFRALPIVFGVSFGFLSMVFVMGIGLGPVITAYPAITTALRLICAAYIFWLALKIARMSQPGAPDVERAEPIGFVQASLLQLVNPKAWTVALIVTVSYTVPENYLVNLALMIGIFALVNIPSISSWALFGMGLGKLMTHPRSFRIFNITMAVLLIAAMLPVLLDLPQMG